MCSPRISWLQLLPIVFLALRATYKEDLHASPAELLFDTTLRVPGDLFVSNNVPANPITFVEMLRTHFRTLKPVPTSHVFRRLGAIKPPLIPPYTGPHRILRRLDDAKYVIEIDGQAKTISISDLKPTYLATNEFTDPC